MNYSEFSCMIYNIKQGDTLYNISRTYNVPIALILRANPYVDIYNLQVGDELCIPVMNPSAWNNAVTYVIQDEAALQAVLDQYGIDLEDVLEFNNLNGVPLTPGMTIQIPVYDM
ncbi:LysM peptidoglycan-binding domain-containing protein [Anaerocolumna sp. AGMB13025]|uniref:LysM peptidoglycan-binding domain-containing protein n=1 Tax=Anaerocolumna sp. AGMB13025 TaxID=3039116 RepID=UPI00241CE031|nr:LysM peptidoglycan-binding domain-containing protein [Anaerocolumna sp. AGMB13025]WFR59838.1 LysM peptidoglycan-binding domain-containing protein [Anaerocolumna sp. AGMB13025]